MSQTKVQLIAPIGIVTASTVEITGVVTATTLVGDIAGTVTGITSTTDNLDVGIVSATAFVGDFTGTASSIVTGSNVTAGIITGTKFVGNATGTVSGLADDTNINIGILTSTSFVGDLTGNAAGLSTTTANLSLGIVTATSFAGNITGNAAGISVTTTNANLGIITASAFHGDATNMTGVSGGPVSQQAVTANSGTTTIDLSSGNLIYMTQSSNTTVSFANTEGNTDVVYLIRTKDDTATARTITWPSTLSWDGGSEPNLAYGASDYQVFKLTTRDNGATWYGNVSAENTTIRTLYAWGRNYKGLLGLNQAHDFMLSSPVQVPGTNWLHIPDTGGDASHFTITKNDGTLWSWGYNDQGGIGNNTSGANSNYSSPVQVGSDTTWASGGAGNYQHSYGVKTDGTLWAWGYNSKGQLGQNSTVKYSSPIQIPGTTWSSGVTKGTDSYQARAHIKTDGTLWVWGYGNYGHLGQGDRTTRSSPVQIPGTTWATVSGTYQGFLSTKTDGTLWGWGMNYRGTLGQNSIIQFSSPVQIPGTTWSKLGGTNDTIGAIKTDGTLWCWATGGSGEIGNNISGPGKHHSSPVQVPGTTWSEMGGSSIEMLATKTDGTLWAWGSNSYGGLGQGDRTQYSSPVQIPGTNWTVTRGNLATLALQKPTLN